MVEQSASQQVEICPAIGRPFQQFKPINLAFDLPLRERRSEHRGHSGKISENAAGEADQFGNMTATSGEEPVVQVGCGTPAESLAPMQQLLGKVRVHSQVAV